MMRRLLALVFTGALAIVLTACGGSSNHQPAAERLKAARAFLDNSPAINFTLSTPSVPNGVTAVLSATGVGTHQPGFQGTIKVVFSGLPTNVPVVAVNGKVWAQVLGPWQVINPAQYGAPDPAALMSKTTGVSSLLTSATGLDNGSQTRDGSTIVTTYKGTVAGSVVGNFIPVANSRTNFSVSFSLTDDNHLTAASITGPFFAHASNVTYNVTMSACTDCKPVTPPKS
jgi:lipoprotein LprG